MKPNAILSYLEHEPIVYFGCTWAEIKLCIFKAFILAIVFEMLLLTLPLPAGRPLTIIPSVLLWIFLSSRKMRKIRSMRTGKPLYYQRHVTMIKRPGLYIDPNSLVQVERNGGHYAQK